MQNPYIDEAEHLEKSAMWLVCSLNNVVFSISGGDNVFLFLFQERR